MRRTKITRYENIGSYYDLQNCKKAFRKDLSDFDEADQFCPYCDNEFFIPAATGNMPAPQPQQRDEDAADPESLMESRLKKSHI